MPVLNAGYHVTALRKWLHAATYLWINSPNPKGKIEATYNSIQTINVSKEDKVTSNLMIALC
jgi:hypothetical protein